MSTNMGIQSWIQQHKNQLASEEMQQTMAESQAPAQLTNAQQVAQNGQLTVEQAYQTAASAGKLSEEMMNHVQTAMRSLPGNLFR